MTHYLATGPEDAAHTLVLAHGAGAPMDSPWMEKVAAGLAGKGIRIVRFEFPYMASRREGRRPGPDRPAVLLESWRSVVAELGGGAGLAIGGKSMGGRIASMVADGVGARALVCLGYPFHPPGRPEKTRTEHLAGLTTRALIVQGTRDPFGGRGEVAAYGLSGAIQLHWLEDGDHDFKPRKASGQTQDGLLAEAVVAVARFLQAPS